MLALNAVNSPFVSGKEPTNKDILNFLRICSVDFDGFFKLKKPTWREMYFYYKMEYWPIFKARVLLCIKMFVEESLASPLVRNKKEGKQSNDILMNKDSLPELLMLIALLMAKLNLREKEALEMPIGRALCYSYAYAALEGGELAVVPEEEASIDDIKSEMAAHEAEMAKRMRLAMDNGKVQKRKVKTKIR